MDYWTRNHLAVWLERWGPSDPGESAQAYEDIMDMVAAAHPEVLDTMGWDEILTLARRNRADGLLPKREEG